MVDTIDGDWQGRRASFPFLEYTHNVLFQPPTGTSYWFSMVFCDQDNTPDIRKYTECLFWSQGRAMSFGISARDADRVSGQHPFMRDTVIMRRIYSNATLYPIK